MASIIFSRKYLNRYAKEFMFRLKQGKVELIKHLIDKKSYSADMICLDYKINVGSRDKHIKADVVVVQEGKERDKKNHRPIE